MNNTGSLKLKKELLSKSVDYSDMDTVREGEKSGMVTRKQRSKSIDHLNQSQVPVLFLICFIAPHPLTAICNNCMQNLEKKAKRGDVAYFIRAENFLA